MSATTDALIAENRELRRELRSHQERLRAIEASRWWRLHPRRLLPGGRAVVDPGHPTKTRKTDVLPQRPTSQTSHWPVADPSLVSFYDEVVARGSFTEDWVTSRFSEWRSILVELESRPARILEIGSFEGLSACYLLWRLPLATITCIDTFVGPAEQAGVGAPGLERAFDANVALVDASRVRKLVGDSRHRLLELLAEEARYELVYVDGSHLGLDVLVDAALSWQLLAPRGVIVFDDYLWTYLGQDPLLRPGKAIDAFREIVDARSELLFENYQIALRRVL